MNIAIRTGARLDEGSASTTTFASTSLDASTSKRLLDLMQKIEQKLSKPSAQPEQPPSAAPPNIQQLLHMLENQARKGTAGDIVQQRPKEFPFAIQAPQAAAHELAPLLKEIRALLDPSKAALSG